MSGIFGVVSRHDCLEDLFYGTDYLSHLGTEYGGLVVFGEKIVRKIHTLRQSQFKSKFYDDYNAMHGNMGLGVISSNEVQPICLDSKFGPFCICATGLIQNAEELVDELSNQGVSFSEISEKGVNSVELIAKLIAEGKCITDGINHMFSKIRGSCSLLLLSKEGIYAARDKFGYSPLVIGQKGDSWAATSETTAFFNIGFKIKKYLSPGEIVLLTPSGMSQKYKGTNIGQINAFLWIYTGFPTSSYEGINVEVVRERCGRYLAKNDDVRADMVAGVPDSGTTHAIGYSLESGIPFRRPLIKYTPGWDRSYTPPSQETRELIARMKLIPVKEIIEGQRIILCDDSIVRGTQLRNIIQKLWDNGAKEIHLRIACPPLLFPSVFDYSTRTREELAARRAIKAIAGKDVEDVSEYIDPDSEKYRKMVDYIAKELGVTSLKYQRLDDMVKAIGLPRERLNLYMWTGESIASPKNDATKRKA
ncbi:MAG TPA: amidophosphoribosyltransferase [Hadesarchaea archaeon]|nr:amidophosphoribosyltransferase [Hadesarchaea archaeon]